MMLNLRDKTKKDMTFVTYRRTHRTTLRTCGVASDLVYYLM
jgi:hypothetical protein